MKSRGVYETPGGTILYRAHEVLETLVLDRDTLHKKKELAVTFGELVYDGKWFTPLRHALSAFVEDTQQNVTGKVRLRLYKGNIINAGVCNIRCRRRIPSVGCDRIYQHLRPADKSSGNR